MYRLTLSNMNDTYESNEHSSNGSLKKITVHRRKIEIDVLTVIMGAAYNEQKTLSDMNMCGSFLQALDNIEDNDTHIEVDKADLKNIKLGIEKTTGRRSLAWAKCVNLFGQLEDPDKFMTI